MPADARRYGLWYNIFTSQYVNQVLPIGEKKGMSQLTQRQALFAGLVYDEEGNVLETTLVGSEPHYVILDEGFRRHVASEVIDRQVINWLQEQALANKNMVSEGIMSLLGKDDLFTKAMIDSSLDHMDKVIEQGLPDDARMMLGMMGFKIIVNIHGELVNLDMPAQEMPGDEGEPWD